MKTVELGKCLLLQLLKRKGITQTELSDHCGISVNQLSMYRNNQRHMSLQTALLVATCLNCEVRELYEWKIKDR